MTQALFPLLPDNGEQSLPQQSDDPHRITFVIRLVNLLAVVLPFLGLVLAIILLWGRGFNGVQLGLLLGMGIPTSLAITIGYHRLFTHQAFRARATVRAILAVLGGMAVEGPVVRWAAIHRRHHQYSDREDDPHSPHLHGQGIIGMFKGLWHAHVGWLFQPDPPRLYRYVPDLLADRLVTTTSKLFPLWVIVGALIPTVLGGLLTMSWLGAFLGFLWGGLARVFFVHHLTWSINSVCHFWGSQPFECHDHSRNNFLFGVIGFGEGWHNNHHAFPTSARHGLRWWQVDISYWIIRLMAVLRLAWELRLPPKEALARKRRGGKGAMQTGPM